MVHSRKKQFNITYINIAKEVSKLSRCKRAKVGAVIVKDKNIISYGYNGTPCGFCNICEDKNGNTKNEVIHAEANAIIKAGINSFNAEIYLTLSPCVDCCKLIKQAGIKKVYFAEYYRDVSGLKKLKIKYEKIDL